ncbi:MAG: phage tail tape measure protein [Lachnospiraceae bacterium]|nr:phage tail tape measure protein [Lachnospiraceae bacterium]
MVTGVKKLGGTLGSVAAGGLKVFTAGIGAASTGLSALGAASFKAGSNFEAEMSKVSAISGATADDLNALKEKAKEMGASTKFSATESAYALEYMAMAGWKTEDMLSGIEGIMNLAAASGEDLATTSDIVTDALTAFGLSASDSGHFADVLAKASSNANTNVSMLGESFKYVAPVAGALGYSAEDTAIALGIMANAGIKGSQSGTALRSSLTRLVKPTDEAAAMMEEYNLTMTNSDGSMKSLGQVMDMLRGNLGDLTEAEQAQAAAQIFGQEAMSGMLAIINASDSDYAKLTDAIYNADGAARQMADTMPSVPL